jgi:hypothetical protein
MARIMRVRETNADGTNVVTFSNKHAQDAIHNAHLQTSVPIMTEDNRPVIYPGSHGPQSIGVLCIL